LGAKDGTVKQEEYRKIRGEVEKMGLSGGIGKERTELQRGERSEIKYGIFA
jgi:hypothetical protein